MLHFGCFWKAWERIWESFEKVLGNLAEFERNIGSGVVVVIFCGVVLFLHAICSFGLHLVAFYCFLSALIGFQQSTCNQIDGIPS